MSESDPDDELVRGLRGDRAVANGPLGALGEALRGLFQYRKAYEQVRALTRGEPPTEWSISLASSQAASSARPEPAAAVVLTDPVRLVDVLSAFGLALNASLAGFAQKGVQLLAVWPKLATASDGTLETPDKDLITLAVTHPSGSIMLQVTYLADERITEFAVPFEHRVAVEGSYLEIPLVDAATRRPVTNDAGHVVRLKAGPARGGYINVPDLPGGQRAIDVVQLLAAGLRESGLSIELV